MSAPITFYDITSTLQDKAWSPNTWKVRYALNMKRIPHTTVWLTHPEIEPEMRRIGAPPTVHGVSQTVRYTLPVIHDPNTGRTVSDSLAILGYLDAQHPSAPALFPRGTHALQAAFVGTSVARVHAAMFALVVLQMARVVVPETRGAWVRVREEWLGAPLEAVAAPGARWARRMRDVLDALGDIDRYLQANGDGARFVMGDALSAADVAIAGSFTRMKRVAGEDSEEWKTVMSAHNGRWARFMDAFREWEVVDG